MVSFGTSFSLQSNLAPHVVFSASGNAKGDVTTEIFALLFFGFSMLVLISIFAGQSSSNMSDFYNKIPRKLQKCGLPPFFPF